MGLISDGLQFAGKVKAWITLITGIFFAIVFFVVGFILMIRNKQIGIGLLLVFLGAIILVSSVLIFYWVYKSKTVATVYGAYAIADDVLDIV